MKISIIIATWNAAKTLNRCLDSIVPQLTNETELIIIDGGSKDNTNEIIDSYGNQVSVHITEPDKGIYDAWNKGVKNAKGDWVMFIGADDILLPNAINSYLEAIRNTPNVNSYDYICAHNEYVDMKGKLLKILGGKPTWSKMRRSMIAAHVASLHNRYNLFEKIGGYNLNFKICADYELLLRKKSKLKALMIPAHIARMTVGGMSFSTKAIIETYKIRELHHSLPSIVNKLLFIKDWIAFKLFIFRKKMGGVLSFSGIITRIKGEDYQIDSSIPLTCLFKLFCKKSCDLLYGMIRFRTFKRVFVSPSSIIICGSKIHFGKNFSIGKKCYINAMSKNGLICGDNVSIGYQTYIELTGSLHQLADKMVIGNNVGLGSHGFYGCGKGGLEIGDDTIIGNYVSFHPENHVFADTNVLIRKQGVVGKGIKIGMNCWIGAKATFLDGTILGNGCVVAAGAVVTGHFPDNSIIGGIPAKIIKKRE